MPLCNYKWNENKTDVYSIDDNVENNKEKDIKLITDFFKKINTENLGPGLVKKLYENNYNSIKDNKYKERRFIKNRRYKRCISK